MIGLPMLNGFIGEFLILSSTFSGVSRGWAVIATLGVILSAAYMLWLVQRLFYGPESALASSRPSVDLHLGELAILWPFVVLMVVMGVVPSLWINTIESRAGSSALKGSAAPPQASLSVATHAEGQP
jgi:NADH-quinone oxidoreductase subunit M